MFLIRLSTLRFTYFFIKISQDVSGNSVRTHEWITTGEYIKFHHRYIVSKKYRRRRASFVQEHNVSLDGQTQSRPPPRKGSLFFSSSLLSLFLSRLHLHARDSGGCFSWLYEVLRRIHLSARVARSSRLGEHDRIARKTRGKSDGGALFSSMTCA